MYLDEWGVEDKALYVGARALLDYAHGCDGCVCVIERARHVCVVESMRERHVCVSTNQSEREQQRNTKSENSKSRKHV